MAIAMTAAPQGLKADNHVVSPQEMRTAIVESAQKRQQNQRRLVSFLSTPKATKALRSAQIDPKQVTTAVASLSDEDLERLAARADNALADFAAGRLSDRDILWVLVAIAGLILIIVAVR